MHTARRPFRSALTSESRGIDLQSIKKKKIPPPRVSPDRVVVRGGGGEVLGGAAPEGHPVDVVLVPRQRVQPLVRRRVPHRRRAPAIWAPGGGRHLFEEGAEGRGEHSHRSFPGLGAVFRGGGAPWHTNRCDRLWLVAFVLILGGRRPGPDGAAEAGDDVAAARGEGAPPDPRNLPGTAAPAMAGMG